MAGEGHAVPKYRQIADDLRSAIESGEYPPRSQLPTKDQIKKRWGVAVNTAERAIEELRRAGLAESVQGSGTYVRERLPEPESDLDALAARVAALEREMAGVLDRLDGFEIPGAATKPEPVPVVAAIVTSGSGVLITQRRDGKPPWGFPAGKIHPGESPADAGVREVKEETGLEVVPGPEIGRRVHPATSITMIYMASRPAGDTGVEVGDERELLQVRWVDLDEALRLMPDMHEPVRSFLARVLG